MLDCSEVSRLFVLSFHFYLHFPTSFCKLLCLDTGNKTKSVSCLVKISKIQTQSALFIFRNTTYILLQYVSSCKGMNFHEIVFCVCNADGLLQLHKDFTTYEQHSSVRVWNIRLQPYLCLHSKCLYETVVSVADSTCACLVL